MQRKLTVIFSADVVGYSGLMERDEAGTLERLKENRKTLGGRGWPIAQGHDEPEILHSSSREICLTRADVGQIRSICCRPPPGRPPVQRMNAHEKALGSEKPTRYAAWFTDTFLPSR